MAVPELTIVACFPLFLQEFSRIFARRESFDNFITLVTGWILTTGRRTVTEVLLAAGAIGDKHFCALYDFLGRSPWSIDEIGKVLLRCALYRRGEEEVVEFAIDDTLSRHSGKSIAGAGMHLDPLRSSMKPKRIVFSFGLNFVVLSVIIQCPFSQYRWFSIPILARLYRNRKTCLKEGKLYRKRTELAAEMIRMLYSWLPFRRLHFVADEAYAGGIIYQALPQDADFTTRLRMDAVLYEPPPSQQQVHPGRPRVKGKRLPSPGQMAQDDSHPWKEVTAAMYGRMVSTTIKIYTGLWYYAARQRLCGIVVVRDPKGKRRDEAFVTTDVEANPVEALARYARRWTLEVAFHDAKQYLGFETTQTRRPVTVERHAPLALCLYGLIVLWFIAADRKVQLTRLLSRPWYNLRCHASFADMLTCLRDELSLQQFLKSLRDNAEDEKFDRLFNLPPRDVSPNRYRKKDKLAA